MYEYKLDIKQLPRCMSCDTINSVIEEETDELNELGKQGWELISSYTYQETDSYPRTFRFLYLKRLIKDNNQKINKEL